MYSRIIKYLTGFIIIFLIQYICNVLVKSFNLILPAPILGLIVFAFLLQINVIKKEWVKDICKFLLKIMPMLFVPLLVGIVVYYSVIEKNLIPILVNVILTATLTLFITALIVDNIIKFIRLQKIRKFHND